MAKIVLVSWHSVCFCKYMKIIVKLTWYLLKSSVWVIRFSTSGMRSGLINYMDTSGGSGLPNVKGKKVEMGREMWSDFCMLKAVPQRNLIMKLFHTVVRMSWTKYKYTTVDTRWPGLDLAQKIGCPKPAQTDQKNCTQGKFGMAIDLLVIKTFDSPLQCIFHH